MNARYPLGQLTPDTGTCAPSASPLKNVVNGDADWLSIRMYVFCVGVGETGPMYARLSVTPVRVGTVATTALSRAVPLNSAATTAPVASDSEVVALDNV